MLVVQWLLWWSFLLAGTGPRIGSDSAPTCFSITQNGGLLDPKYLLPLVSTLLYKRRWWKHVSCTDSTVSIVELQLRSVLGGGCSNITQYSSCKTDTELVKITVGLIGGTRVGWCVHIIGKYWLGTDPTHHRSSAWCFLSLRGGSTAGSLKGDQSPSCNWELLFMWLAHWYSIVYNKYIFYHNILRLHN